MTVSSCGRCGYSAEIRTMEVGCPRCAERAVRAQMRRFAAVQARHLREMRSGGVAGEMGRGRS